MQPNQSTPRSSSEYIVKPPRKHPPTTRPTPGIVWPSMPRKVSRLCLRSCILLGVTISAIVYFGDPRELLRPRGPLLRCDFPLAVDPPRRPHEFSNAFAGYKHFGDKCNISSLEIHRPFDPICATSSSMLKAMSSGGRIGRDAPYIPRGCDLQWFTTEEVCEILGRFSQVVLIGDSMLRHVIGALNIIVRENLGYGGVTDWNFDDREKERCFCNDQFDVTDCSVQGIYKTEDVAKHDPLSLVCPKLFPGWSTDLRIEQMVRYPIEKVELDRLETAIDTSTKKRKAFILGHGLWNDLDVEQSRQWLNTVLEVIDTKLRLRMRLRTLQREKNMSILLMTPNAAGEKKPDKYLVTQGNKALMGFEHAMGLEAERLNIDHLGTWNMSIQATMYDGVHMDMRGNLLKAMMVVNWLNVVDS
ncbi:hypothetical protein GGR50DRAFT_667701 [Xylaria sp. CBS 124048]|nr:hypothetical protein GGR50DRAFT_667701 [Xylaria sp. CBS 124048]